MKLSYCALQVYESDRDRFLQSLFVPELQRESLLAIYALNVELRRIHNNVSEEMIGHIRYAWWYEKLEAMFEGKTIPGHPVMEALEPLIEEGALPKPELLALVETYRAHYPELPHDADMRLKGLSLILLRKICPQAERAWLTADDIVTRHRERYEQGRNTWLAARLLLAGTIAKKRENALK